jgi:hypothetical protein
VDDLNGVLHGAYIRWIDLKRPDRLTLARGAIICDIKIGQNGVLLLCKTHPSPAMFHVSMDEALIFQRLTPQERIILVAMDYMDTSKGSESEGSESSSESEGSKSESESEGSDNEPTGLSGTH